MLQIAANPYVSILGSEKTASSRLNLAQAFNLEDPVQLETFLKGDTREITIPGSGRKLQYDPLARVGVGMSRLGTSEAVAIGAYAFALRKLGEG